MNCQEIQKSLSSFLDGVVSPEEKKLMERHLTSCAQCRAALAELRNAKELLRNLDEVEPPPWLTAKIMARVREEKEQQASFLKKLFFPFYIKVPIQALTVILVGVIVFQVYRTMEPEKKAAQAPVLPSVLTEQKTLKEKAPRTSSKSAEGLAARSPRKTSAERAAPKKAETAPQGYGAPAGELQQPGQAPVPMAKNAPSMSVAAPEEKGEKETAGLAVQTEVPEQRAYEAQPEDAERSAALADKKRAKEEPGPPASLGISKKQVVSEQLLPCITVSTSDTVTAKKVALDIVKQAGGKQIETITQDTTEIILTELPSNKIKELAEQLKSAGEIKTPPDFSALPEGTMRVRIEITPR